MMEQPVTRRHAEWLQKFDPERCPALVPARRPTHQCPYRPTDGDAFCITHQEALRRAVRPLVRHPDAPEDRAEGGAP